MGIYYQDNEVEIRMYSDIEIQEVVDIRKQKSQDKAKEKYKSNTVKRQAARRSYMTKKLKEDPLFKLKHNVKNLIRNSIKGQGYSKSSKTYDILGCSFEEFKQHIEQQFVEGMSWNNYGEWEYDHMTPISWALDEDAIIKLNHYTNFQPLWKDDNRNKRAKFSSHSISKTPLF